MTVPYLLRNRFYSYAPRLFKSKTPIYIPADNVPPSLHMSTRYAISLDTYPDITPN